MARKIKNEEEAAVAGAYSSATPQAHEMIDNSMELINPAPLVADATARVAGEERPHVPPPPKFRVMRSMPATVGGFRTVLREGKILSASEYDIPRLVQQGVVLQELV